MIFYEWDENKRIANFEKHGIDFAEAISIFESFVFTVEDMREDYGEVRFLSIGGNTMKSDIKRLLTMRDDEIDYSDIPAIDPKWAMTAVWEKFSLREEWLNPPNKQRTRKNRRMNHTAPTRERRGWFSPHPREQRATWNRQNMLPKSKK